MARIRTIKPDFFTSDTVSALPLRARLTWIGLWTHCDDYGRCRDNVKLIKAAVWPLDDVSLRDISADLDDLEAAGVVRRYVVEGREYIQITGWTEHQKVDRPSKSPLPAPPPVDNRSNGSSRHVREDIASAREDASSPREGKGKELGREGKGGDSRALDEPSPPTAEPTQSPPPDKCEKHLDNPDPPPCGLCADARRAREEWDRDQAEALRRADLARRSAQARDRAATGRAAIDACRMCDATGYRDGKLCHHDQAVDAARSRGLAAAAAAIRKPKPTTQPTEA